MDLLLWCCKVDDRKFHFNGNHLRDHCSFYRWRRIVYEREEQLLDVTAQPPNMFPLPAAYGIIHHLLQGLWQLVTVLRPHQWQQGQICKVRLSLLLLPLLPSWSLSAEAEKGQRLDSQDRLTPSSLQHTRLLTNDVDKEIRDAFPFLPNVSLMSHQWLPNVFWKKIF